MSLLPIDTQQNSSFLNASKLYRMRKLIEECKADISTQTNKRDILKTVQKYLIFDRVFKSLGVQGIAGILKTRKGGEQMVFKISIDLDKTIEHENIVSSDLNRMREYCPHFVGNIGMINLPVSNDFINNPETGSLFRNSNDYFPCNVMLIEYVSPISFYHICKYLHEDRSVIISQLVQVMMALAYGQNKCKLTHYDCHLDNVLVRKCDPNALFLYKYKGKNILVPTYGLYPVIIDLGSSYVEAIEGHPMYTSADNYNNGLQPTLYDNLNDIHHLLISVFYYLEDKGYVYDFLLTRIMYIFRHLPILAHKGWKQLPHDISDLILKQITDECDIGKYDVFKSFGGEIIEILNGLIILPWNEGGEHSFKGVFESFIEQVQIIANIKSIGHGDEILFVLRETVDLIHKHRKAYDSSPVSTIKKFSQEWKEKVSFIIHHNTREIPSQLDFKKLFVSAIRVSDCMSSNYYNYVKSHVEIINDGYKKTPIKGPVDMVKILLQNATPGFTVDTDSIVYVWDSNKERNKVVNMSGVSSKIIKEINDAPIAVKGNIMSSLVEEMV